MKLVCPGCGGTYSLEGWENDAAVRQFNGIMGDLAPPVREHAARYLGLFRVGVRGLSWKRALRILQELKELVGSGMVHWEGGETRPAPPALWAEVMIEMCEKGKRELDSHNYLRKVVWTRARGLAAEKERSVHHRDAESTEMARDQEKIRKRGCFCCEAFRAPRGCEINERPVSGNQMLGCGKWKQKAATDSVGSLMSSIVRTMENEE